MFKKFCALAALVLLMSCRSVTMTPATNEKGGSVNLEEEAFATQGSFRVGVLLPLTGSAARYGQGLKRAALMALEDMNNDNMILQFYDTQSSPAGAEAAVNNAIEQKAQLIIGPLTSSSVKAISPITKSYGIPVVAFSSDASVLQSQVYTLGLLVEEQVNRIIGYAIAKGRRNFALLVPDNATGLAVARAAVKRTAGSNAKIGRIAFYSPQTNDFSEIISQLSDYEKRSAAVTKEKNRLKALADKGDINATRELRRLSLKDTDSEVDFDAVLIPESGAKLKSAVAMFGYYDVFAPQVKFLGTSVWENTRLNKESTLIGSWYPSMSRTHKAYFNQRYYSLFNEYPQTLYAFAYDAVALASALAKANPQNIDAAITTEDGFFGISGMFRILPDGKNEHSLDIMEITKSGDIVAEMASKKFAAALPEGSIESAALVYDANPPLIFGKDQAEGEKLIFGRTLRYTPPFDAQEADNSFGFAF